MKEEQQPVTGLGRGDVAPNVFLCGDPARVPKIAAGWSDVREVCRLREFVVRTGSGHGVAMTAASTGIGGPSTAVLLEELVKLGGRTFIRVGNSGALAESVALGDAVITTAAVRDDGASRSYVRPEYPAAADYRVTSALVGSAEAKGVRHHAGVTWSIDGFYAANKVLLEDGGLGSMSVGGFEQEATSVRMRDMQRCGVLNVEMEASTLLTLASLFGVRAGCICTVSDRVPWPGPGEDMIEIDKNIQAAIDIAVEAMTTLAASG